MTAARTEKPVLLLLTSPAHPLDTLELCLERLEACTDLERFAAVLLCANAPEAARLELLQGFAARRPHVLVQLCEPLGALPCVPRFQNQAMARHPEAPILKMDDDVFVTPGWFEALWRLYRLSREDGRVGMVMPLTPVNTIGVQAMWQHLTARYRAEFMDLLIRGPELGSNLDLHLFLWQEIIHGPLLQEFAALTRTRRAAFSGPGSYASINCVLFDQRLSSRIHPFPEWGASIVRTRGPAYDESLIHEALLEHDLQCLVALDSVVHHYSFHKVEQAMRTHLPLEDVAHWLRSQGTAGNKCAAA